MTDERPGRRLLSGYLLRDLDDVIVLLAEARHARGMTLMRVGAVTDHPFQQIHVWLTGKTDPSARNLFELAAGLGCDLALIPREDA